MYNNNCLCIPWCHTHILVEQHRSLVGNMRLLVHNIARTFQALRYNSTSNPVLHLQCSAEVVKDPVLSMRLRGQGVAKPFRLPRAPGPTRTQRAKSAFGPPRLYNLPVCYNYVASILIFNNMRCRQPGTAWLAYRSIVLNKLLFAPPGTGSVP